MKQSTWQLTVKTLCFKTKRSQETAQTQIRLLLRSSLIRVCPVSYLAIQYINHLHLLKSEFKSLLYKHYHYGKNQSCL